MHSGDTSDKKSRSTSMSLSIPTIFHSEGVSVDKMESDPFTRPEFPLDVVHIILEFACQSYKDVAVFRQVSRIWRKLVDTSSFVTVFHLFQKYSKPKWIFQVSLNVQKKIMEHSETLLRDIRLLELFRKREFALDHFLSSRILREANGEKNEYLIEFAILCMHKMSFSMESLNGAVDLKLIGLLVRNRNLVKEIATVEDPMQPEDFKSLLSRIQELRIAFPKLKWDTRSSGFDKLCKMVGAYVVDPLDAQIWKNTLFDSGLR